MANSVKHLVIFFMFLSVIHGFNFIHDFYMQDTTGGSCNENINVENNLFLRSHIGSFQLGNLIKYGDNQDCTVTLDAGTGKRILLQFVKFDMQPKVSGQCVDYIEINDSNAELSLTSSQAPVITTEAMTTEAMTTPGSATDISTGTSATQDSTTQASTTQISSTDGTTSDSTGSTATDGTDGTTQDTSVTSGSSAGVGHHILCGDSASPYESGGRNLTMRFVTDGSVTASGFKILVMSFKESGTCSSEEFKCDTNRCISNTLKCDTVYHCLDQSDENKNTAGCTLLDDIIGTLTGLGSNVLIAIIVIAGIVVLVPVSSIIIYQCCCKKADAPTDSETVSETRPKKLPKNVVDVEPVDTKKKGKASKSTDKDDW